MNNQEEFLAQIKSVVLSFDDKAQVILYGSRARGDYNEDSDWDLLVLTSQIFDENRQRELRDKIYDIELAHSQAISTNIVDTNEWKRLSITGFYQNVTSEGVAL